MRLGADVETRIDAVGRGLADALGANALCVAVYGSAASEEFSPAHSDVNLVIVLQSVSFADLRLIGTTLARLAPRDLRFATPLVIRRGFLSNARDAFPIELADLHDRHRVVAGGDLLAEIAVSPDRLRVEAERESRGKLLRLRSLVIHRPPDAEVHQALAGVEKTFAVLARSLLKARGIPVAGLGGAELFEAVSRDGHLSVRVLPLLAEMRDGGRPWPRGADLDELLAGLLAEIEALVAFIDAPDA
jgi:hypothetical protein